jgi:hypothetical protein
VTIVIGIAICLFCLYLRWVGEMKTVQ